MKQMMISLKKTIEIRLNLLLDQLQECLMPIIECLCNLTSTRQLMEINLGLDTLQICQLKVGKVIGA